jgi:hypothetical protein
MVDQSDLIAASVYSQKLSRDLSSSSSLRERRGSGSEVARLQNRSGCPPHSLGLSCVGIRPLLPKTGHGSARPSTEASGPHAADASGTTAVDVLGLSSPKVASLRSPTSATTTAPSSWPTTGRSGMTTGGGASTIPTSAATGGSAGESAMAPVGVDAGADNKSGGLGAVAASATTPGTMAAPTVGSAGEACPMTTRNAWAPRWRAPCAEANQPAWRTAAPVAEAGFVLRAFVGARLAKPCLRLLKERDGKFKTHSEKTETGVSSDTYPLQTKANRACGEAPRAPIPTGAAEGCPAAGFGTVSASDAQGTEGAACTGIVTTAEGPTSCAASAGTCSGGRADRPDPPESQQLSRPRGQVPPRPTSAPRIGTLASRPQALMVPAHLEAGSATPGQASGPG